MRSWFLVLALSSFLGCGKNEKPPKPLEGGGGQEIGPGGKQQPPPRDPNQPSEAKILFANVCSQCHGMEGKGDGPDSNGAAADLTDEFRTELNPEGVLYYKIWNGHPPAMPAFKSKFTKDETWTLVEYVKSLRKP